MVYSHSRAPGIRSGPSASRGSGAWPRRTERPGVGGVNILPDDGVSTVGAPPSGQDEILGGPDRDLTGTPQGSPVISRIRSRITIADDTLFLHRREQARVPVQVRPHPALQPLEFEDLAMFGDLPIHVEEGLHPGCVALGGQGVHGGEHAVAVLGTLPDRLEGVGHQIAGAHRVPGADSDRGDVRFPSQHRRHRVQFAAPGVAVFADVAVDRQEREWAAARPAAR